MGHLERVLGVIFEGTPDISPGENDKVKTRAERFPGGTRTKNEKVPDVGDMDKPSGSASAV